MIRQIEYIDPESNFALLSCAHQVHAEPCRGDSQCRTGGTLYCKKCESLDFPDDVNAYMSSKVFDQDTVPKGLTSAHSTKERTWGRIVIESGSLDYVVDDLDNKRFALSPGVDGIIAPQMMHHLEINEPVQFHLEFFAKGK